MVHSRPAEACEDEPVLTGRDAIELKLTIKFFAFDSGVRGSPFGRREPVDPVVPATFRVIEVATPALTLCPYSCPRSKCSKNPRFNVLNAFRGTIKVSEMLND
jgi:hypothetical protein